MAIDTDDIDVFVADLGRQMIDCRNHTLGVRDVASASLTADRLLAEHDPHLHMRRRCRAFPATGRAVSRPAAGERHNLWISKPNRAT
jgi:hypothetical protein